MAEGLPSAPEEVSKKLQLPKEASVASAEAEKTVSPLPEKSRQVPDLQHAYNADCCTQPAAHGM